ncbi:MAG: 50S ribosomal protein L32e [Thermoplasmataceae archaeon]|jgi:large subunit ribosomal protein L32e|nr:50S ribosomal protein L32e [Candidatus Thermoplasmatota archaeon]
MVDPKPKMDSKKKKLLKKKIKQSRKRPEFKRQEWFRYGKFDESWRKPRGKHSKLREHQDWRPPVVDSGYRGPRATRGLHPSGFSEVMVHNVADLGKLNRETEAARIGSTVGSRKRKEIVEKADEMNIRVLNRGTE